MNIIEILSDINTKYFLTLIFPLLYAETHYRFKYFFSYLKKNEPEIIIDIPSRLKRGDLLPVLLIIKDADKYPVVIQSITVFEKGQCLVTFPIQKRINQTYYDIINELNTSKLATGGHEFTIQVRYKIGKKEKICISDNHRGTSHQPLLTYISEDSLPRLGHCLYGETHCHTNYTSDQVEFGASLSATASMAQSQGLDFFCAADHSYDLDDHEDNFLLNDPDLKKWKKFRTEVQEINKINNDVLIIPGEEVTVRNSRQQNVHLLVYNSDEFYPGSGDSGEKWFKTYSESSIEEIVQSIKQNAFCFAAHPAESTPLLQRLFINRGEWQSDDCRTSGLNGLQFINGGEEKYKLKGRDLWIEQLLSGHKLIGLAGNDAHGNFSRFRQIGFPFFTMRENNYHLFGIWRTGVYCVKNQIVEIVLEQMGNGNCFLTNGPALQMKVKSDKVWHSMGSSCLTPSELKIELLSTDEYAPVHQLKIFIGDIIKGQEISLYDKKIGGNTYRYSYEITLSDLPLRGYLRSEAITQKGYEALSNPIWFG